MPRGFYIKEKYSHELNKLIVCCIFKGGNPYMELFYHLILYYEVNRLKQIKTMVAILWSCCCLQNENWTQITREKKRKDKFGHKGATYRIVLATFACMLQNKSKI